MNNNDLPITSINQLRKPDWEKLRKDVNTRIDVLETLVRTLEPGPLNDKIATDLIFPCIATLGSFICSVEIEDEDTLPEEDTPDPYEREAAKAAVNTLVRENERLRDKHAAAANDEVIRSLEVDLLQQDLDTIRRIISKGGSAADILKFLDTPPA